MSHPNIFDILLVIIAILALCASFKVFQLYKIKHYTFKVYVENDEGAIKVYRFKTEEKALKFLHKMDIQNKSAYLGED